MPIKHTIHHKRYLNALKKAAKINRYIKQGYHVLFENTPLKRGFILCGKEIVLKTDSSTSFIFYTNDENYDDGYYTTIKEYNKEFNNYFSVYNPSAKIKL